MDHCELGSLDDLLARLSRRSSYPPEGFLWKVLWEMSTALCYLQTGEKSASLTQSGRWVSGRARGWDKILHRDIKPANIFLTYHHRSSNSAYPTAVLGDFGGSILGRDRVDSHMTAFTRAFGPPEQPQYNDTSDMYSLALCVHCVAPLRSEPRRRSSVRADPVPGYASRLRDVLGRMLRTHPEDRVDAGYLPYLVFREMSAVKRERAARGCRTEMLPRWAFGQ